MVLVIFYIQLVLLGNYFFTLRIFYFLSLKIKFDFSFPSSSHLNDQNRWLVLDVIGISNQA